VGATMLPVTVTELDEVRGTEADTAIGTTKAAIKAKTVIKTNNFFISSPNYFLFCFFIYVFRVSLYCPTVSLIGPVLYLRF
jgi:hypothetical protein